MVGRYAAGCRWLRLVLRFWDNGAAPALMLAVRAVAQGCGQRSELFNRWTDYHYYGFRYENKTLLDRPCVGADRRQRQVQPSGLCHI